MTAGRPEAARAIRVRIEGQVQNVWFRAWTTEQAIARGLRGWVRNRRDGTVEALFVGTAAKLADMVAACREGPPLAQVSRVIETPAADEGSRGFRPRPTE